MSNQSFTVTESLRQSFKKAFENSNCDPMEKFFYQTTEEWYKAKHSISSEDEINLINSIEMTTCPLCGSSRISKYGYEPSGSHKFYCRDCRRYFNPLTNTLFQDRKIPLSEWIEFVVHLVQYHSVTTSAIDNRNASSTGFYWLNKIFIALRGVQDDILLKNNVYIDEKYVPEKPRDTEFKDEKNNYRGLSRNKICIFCGTDLESTIMIANGHGKPSKKRIIESMSKHIMPGSTLYGDEEKTHNELVESLNLKHMSYNSKKLKLLEDKDNPLEPINNVHRFFTKFIKSHGSYDRENLQDWLNLFVIIWNCKKDIPSILAFLFDRILKLKTTLKYRDFY